MNVWVTGAGGLLGSALCRALSDRSIAFRGSLKSEADVTDRSSLECFVRQFGPFTHIVHCAAYTHVDAAESAVEEAEKLNSRSPALIGALAAEKNMRAVHLSTDYVFDGLSNHPYRETDPTDPQTAYGLTKAQGEKNLLARLPSACIVRTSWLFGNPGKNFVSTLLQLMREKEEIRVVCDQIGRPTYAPDLAGALIGLLNESGIFHAANSGPASWYELAETLYATAIQKWPLRCRKICPVTSEEFAARARRPRYSVLDTAKLEQVMGRAMRPWREALQEMICASS